LQAGHAGRDRLPWKGKTGQARPVVDPLGQVLETEQAVADAGRRGPMVKDGHGYHVDLVEIDAKGAKSAGQSVKIQVPITRRRVPGSLTA